MLAGKAAYNNDCINCGDVHKEMIVIGVVYFCKQCAVNGFGVKNLENGFTRESEAGILHKTWLKKLHKKQIAG